MNAETFSKNLEEKASTTIWDCLVYSTQVNITAAAGWDTGRYSVGVCITGIP